MAAPRTDTGHKSVLLDRILTLAGVSAVVIFSLQRWQMVGAYPPGLDGAQWLALGRGLHEHGVGRSSDGAYAPLVPVLATVAEAALGSLPAVRLLATAACLIVSAAIWCVFRSLLGAGWGLLAAAFAVPASALAEPLFYGGYPQQVALAAGLIALWATCLSLLQPEPWRFAIIGVAGGVAALAHHVYFPLMVLTIGAAAALALPCMSSTARLRTLWRLFLALLPAGGISAIISYKFIEAGYAAPLAASTRSASDAWHYAMREAPGLWLMLLLLALVGLAVTGNRRLEPAKLMAISLILPAGILLMVSGQPRLAPPILVGTALGVGIGARDLANRATAARPAIALVALAAAGALATAAQRDASRFAEFYQVASPSLIEAAEAIANGGTEAGAVAVRQDLRGWPVGWWFEALLTRPVLVASDPQWLAFPDERRRAADAAVLFDGQLEAAEFLALAEAEDVRYLVTPTWDWIGWDRWLRTPDYPVMVLFRDEHYLVLKITRQCDKARISRSSTV